MVKPQINPDTNETYPDFGVMNDKDGEYKKYKSKVCEEDVMYIIKATAPINTEAHANCQTQLSSGKIKFLIDERTAKAKLLGTKVGQNMTPEKRVEYLRPFTLPSILEEEMLNLKEENEGLNIILKQANKGIKKDKFSASKKEKENLIWIYTLLLVNKALEQSFGQRTKSSILSKNM